MAKKKTPAAQAQGNKEAAKIETPGADVVPNQSPQPAVEEDEPVKVNNGSLQEMRYAVEDFVKEHYTRDEAYDASHVGEDVHLALGWTCVIISGLTSLYAWYTPFAQSKKLTAVGIGLYFLLAGVNWLWDNCIVKDTIFVGKRKLFVQKRVQNATLTIKSKQMTQPKENPSLRLTATYVLASQDGTVLATDETTQRHLSYNEVFDEQGYLHKEKLAVVLDKLERDTAKMS